MRKKTETSAPLSDETDETAGASPSAAGAEQKEERKPESAGIRPLLVDELPAAADIKQRIIRRVYEIVETCTDPKKLMDTYEAVSKFERESGQKKESLFDMIEKKLAKK